MFDEYLGKRVKLVYVEPISELQRNQGQTAENIKIARGVVVDIEGNFLSVEQEKYGRVTIAIDLIKRIQEQTDGGE